MLIMGVSTIGWILWVCIWIALAFWPARVAGRTPLTPMEGRAQSTGPRICPRAQGAR